MIECYIRILCIPAKQVMLPPQLTLYSLPALPPTKTLFGNGLLSSRVNQKANALCGTLKIPSNTKIFKKFIE